MNFNNWINSTYQNYDDPTENTEDAILCTLCAEDLTHEEITEQDDDHKFCDNCFFSCCGDELNQDMRICPTCKEYN